MTHIIYFMFHLLTTTLYLIDDSKNNLLQHEA